MIRILQRKLIIPRGDTGSFSVPAIATGQEGDIAVFTIFDEVTQTRLLTKQVAATEDTLTITFTHNDTVNLKPGKYLWDIKFYRSPVFVEDELINGEEINSYYAGFSLPVCEVRETGDNYLPAPDSPIPVSQLDLITGALDELNQGIKKVDENVKHYPEIRDNYWYVWDSELNDFVNTGVPASGEEGGCSMEEMTEVEIDEMIYGGNQYDKVYQQHRFRLFL